MVDQSIRNAVLHLIASRQLDYVGTVHALSTTYSQDAIEGAIFELMHEGRLAVTGGVLRPSRRRDDQQSATTPSVRWEYKAVESPFIGQLVTKLNDLGDEGWEVVTVSDENRGNLAAKLHVALLKRRKTEK